MNRRHFLRGWGAAVAGGLVLPKYFLAPGGGWPLNMEGDFDTSNLRYRSIERVSVRMDMHHLRGCQCGRCAMREGVEAHFRRYYNGEFMVHGTDEHGRAVTERLVLPVNWPSLYGT